MAALSQLSVHRPHPSRFLKILLRMAVQSSSKMRTQGSALPLIHWSTCILIVIRRHLAECLDCTVLDQVPSHFPFCCSVNEPLAVSTNDFLIDYCNFTNNIATTAAVYFYQNGAPQLGAHNVYTHNTAQLGDDETLVSPPDSMIFNCASKTKRVASLLRQPFRVWLC